MDESRRYFLKLVPGVLGAVVSALVPKSVFGYTDKYSGTTKIEEDFDPSENAYIPEGIIIQSLDHSPKDLLGHIKSKGKLSLISFSTSTCEPCKWQLPDMNELESKYPNLYLCQLNHWGYIDEIVLKQKLKEYNVKFDNFLTDLASEGIRNLYRATDWCNEPIGSLIPNTASWDGKKLTPKKVTERYPCYVRIPFHVLVDKNGKMLYGLTTSIGKAKGRIEWNTFGPLEVMIQKYL